MGKLLLKSKHRVKCGDSTKAEDVAECLGGAMPFIMVTDPPYGVEYDPGRRGKKSGASSGMALANDDRADWGDAWKLCQCAVCYVWHADLHGSIVAESVKQSGYTPRALIIWKKPRLVMSPYGRNESQLGKFGCYHWQHETCIYGVRSGVSARWVGGLTQTSIWEIEEMNDGAEHCTQKPVECMARPIRNHGGKDDDVYDPFLGSGTTIAACEGLGRRCFGLEIEPRYTDVCVIRWSNLSKQEPVLEATGETFSQVKTRRAAENQPSNESPLAASQATG